MPRLPLLRVLAPFALGIACEDRWLWSASTLIGVVVAAAGLWAVLALASALRAEAGPVDPRSRLRAVAEALLGVALGALALAVRLHAPAPGVGAEPVGVQVLSPPVRSGYGCSMRAWVSGRPGGRVRLGVPESGCDLRPGDWVVGRLRLESLAPRRNPGGHDERTQARRQGIQRRARFVDRAFVRVASQGSLRSRLPRAVERLRRRLGDGLDPPELPSRSGALLRALVTGQRDRLTPELWRSFERAGTLHLLAVSGLHVGLMLGFGRMLARALLSRSRRVEVLRCAPTVAWVAGTGVALAYAALTGLGVPAIRAAAMGLAGTIAVLGGRGPARWNALAAAALCALAVDPGSLFQASLALSFCAVAGILVWSPGPHRLWGSLGCTCAASLATAPWVAAIGGPVPLGSLVVNTLAIPWFGAVVLPSGVCAAAWAGALPSHTNVCLWLARTSAELGIAGIEAGASPDLLEGVARAPWLAAAGAAAGFGARLAWRGYGLPARGLAVCALVLGLGALRPVSGVPGPDEVHVWVLDVGHGDAVLVRTGGGAWLIDAGPSSPRFDAGRSVVLPALRALGVSRLDAIVVTHADQDHIGGAATVVERMPVGRVWLTDASRHHPGARRLLEAAADRGVRVARMSRGERLRQDSAELRVLWPRSAGGPPATSNAGSVVARLQTPGGCVLLPGDAPAEVEAALLDEQTPCAVLKLGHHGSGSSTSAAWLDRLEPSVAVASAAPRARSPLPHPEVRTRLRRRAITLYETALHGAVELRLGPRSLVAAPFRVGPSAPGSGSARRGPIGQALDDAPGGLQEITRLERGRDVGRGRRGSGAGLGPQLHGAAAHPGGELDVTGGIPDHPAPGEVRAQRGLRADQQTGARLATVTARGGQMRAVERGVDPDAAGREVLEQVVLEALEVGVCEVAATDPGLVGHDREPKAGGL